MIAWHLFWWPAGGSGEAWEALGSTRGYAFVYKISDDFLNIVLTFLGWSMIDPGAIFDHLLAFWDFLGTPTCHVGERNGFGPHVEWHAFFENHHPTQPRFIKGLENQRRSHLPSPRGNSSLTCNLWPFRQRLWDTYRKYKKIQEKSIFYTIVFGTIWGYWAN